MIKQLFLIHRWEPKQVLTKVNVDTGVMAKVLYYKIVVFELL